MSWDFGLPRSSVTSHAYSDYAGVLALGLGNGTIILWSPADRSIIHKFRAARDSIQSIAFSPDAHLMAFVSASADYRVALCDFTT